MPFALPNTFVLYDLEWTSWEGAAQRGWNGPREYREVIQIGAIRVDAQLKELGTFLRLVRPSANPQLSAFIIALTGIMQEAIDGYGICFPDALNEFARFCDGAVAHSWGCDHAVLFENAALVAMGTFPMLPRQFIDVRHLFFEHGVSAQDYMSSTIPRCFGLEPPAHVHNALSDARSILMALRALRDSLPT